MSPDSEMKSFKDVVQIAEQEHFNQLTSEQVTPTVSPVAEVVNKVSQQTFYKPKSSAKSTPRSMPFSCYCYSSDKHLANKCPHHGTDYNFCHKAGHLERVSNEEETAKVEPPSKSHR